jgi:hypothetical protein
MSLGSTRSSDIPYLLIVMHRRFKLVFLKKVIFMHVLSYIDRLTSRDLLPPYMSLNLNISYHQPRPMLLRA